MLFGEEPNFPSLSAAWSYLQSLFEPESPESKDTAAQEVIPWFAGDCEFFHTLIFLRESLTVGSASWPHTQSAGDMIIERLRTLAQAVVWAQKTLGLKVCSNRVYRQFRAAFYMILLYKPYIALYSYHMNPWMACLCQPGMTPRFQRSSWSMVDCRSWLVQWSRFRRPTRSESKPGRPSVWSSRM